MLLTPQTLGAIYGKRLFVLKTKGQTPELVPDQVRVISNAPFEEVSKPLEQFLTAPTWQLKPGAKLALVANPDELATLPLRELLGKIIGALGLELAQQHLLLNYSPVSSENLVEVAGCTVLVFGPVPVEKAEEVKRILHFPALAELQDDQAAKRKVWETLKPLKDNL